MHVHAIYYVFHTCMHVQLPSTAQPAESAIILFPKKSLVIVVNVQTVPGSSSVPMM